MLKICLSKHLHEDDFKQGQVSALLVNCQHLLNSQSQDHEFFNLII